MKAKSSKQHNSDEPIMEKSTQWDALVSVPCVRRYIKSLSIWSFLNNYEINLSKKKYLVLGLEGVILCSSINPPKHRVDHIVQYKINNSMCSHFVVFRPMLENFLQMVSEWYTIILYTTKEKEFADGVADYLERRGPIFEKRLYRNDCDYAEGQLLLDLDKVSTDLSCVVVLDYRFGPHTNTLPIERFIGGMKDRNLLSSALILDSLRFCSDVRSILELAHL
ncbi:CTD nuclear envelope phosphatase 1 [Nematocida sp. ERTm5]|nr:CTD nuclear envelope phosphatase 1 [Nematocida sp. AWRm79]KAI5183350.1 CTD nuclear envelope phosphatase 1 [Nematocida sp. AWRm78]OAG33082.1 CTD nuclear envelope phosphatase 1 [Nematocida sp. ERTm5]